MVTLTNVCAGYHGNRILRNVSIAIERGRFVGCAGPNGSGKTTLLRVIAGALSPASGQVHIDGTDVHLLDRRKRARTMACLPQDLALSTPFTVREIVLMGRTPHLTRIGSETAGDLAIAEEAMRLAKVEQVADRPITEISGGERQRAFIAMCLAQEPALLLLDEPTAHLDITHQLSLLGLVRRLNLENSLTVVAVLHDLNLAAAYCDTIAVLKGGQVVAAGSPQDVLTPTLIAEVYGVEAEVRRHPASGKPHVIVTSSPIP